MIYPKTTCRWCGVPLQWTSVHEFVNYAFDYFQRETHVPLEFMTRVYKKPKSSTRWNLCRACYKMNIANIHRREITGKMIRHRSINTTPMIGAFLLKLFNQSWRHKRYIEFMWLHHHSFEAFLDYLHARDILLGNPTGDIFDNEELDYYYEDMVRSHFQVPSHYEPVRDDDDNIISFQLNDTDTFLVNAHPVVE